MDKHVVMFSGGAGSWATAKRAAEQHGTDGLVLLFADTKIEDGDLYRFLKEASANVGGELVEIAEGRDVWQVFFDERFLGNSRIDPCSKILKRQLMRKWIAANCDPATTTIYLGLDWSEPHRLESNRARWAPWRIEAPMMDRPYLDKRDVLDWLRREGIRPPRLYEMGFTHNNCGGFCVKAGKTSFRRLLLMVPERYAYHEGREQELRAYLDKDVAILQNADGSPLTLRDFRLQLQGGAQCSLFDEGGCGCFDGEDEAA